MHITVLVTTRGRSEILSRLFNSLCLQHYKDFSVILGDQTGEGALDDLCALYQDRLIIRRFPLAPCSLSEARNALLPMVDGNIVSFADDDCYFAPEAFSRLVEYTQAYPDVDVFVGRGFPSSVPCHAALAPAQRLNRYSVFSNCPSWCLFVKAEVCQRVGHFDVSMGIGASSPWQSGEETDYLLRILTAGHTVARCPSIHIFHDAESLITPNLDKIASYGMGRMYLIKKHDMPFWFALINIVYPLLWLVYEYPLLGRGALRKRMAMFKGRWEGYKKTHI